MTHTLARLYLIFTLMALVLVVGLAWQGRIGWVVWESFVMAGVFCIHRYYKTQP